MPFNISRELVDAIATLPKEQHDQALAYVGASLEWTKKVHQVETAQAKLAEASRERAELAAKLPQEVLELVRVETMDRLSASPRGELKQRLLKIREEKNAAVPPSSHIQAA